MSHEIKEKVESFVNSLEKITREFPSIVKDRKIFLKLLSYVNILTGTLRSYVFKSLERYLSVCRENRSIEDINDIVRGLKAIWDDILTDSSEDNHQSFLILITSIAKLNLDSGEDLLTLVIPRLKQLFTQAKDNYTRGLFYDLMVFLYDQFDKFKPLVKSALIRGLSDKSKLIRDKLVDFWSD